MDEISKAIKGARAAQVGRIYGSFYNAQQVSSDDDSIRKGNEEEIIKGGKKAVVGEIREWSGKKYRKQANGKWLEVSEHGMTKKDSEKELDRIRFNNQYGHSSIEEQSKLGKIHSNIKNLSDKEYTDKEVGFKKSEDDELNPFEKAAEEADVEKSDVMDALSYQGDIKVSKTGKEIKDQVDTVLLPAIMAELTVKEAEAEKELKNCGTAPTNDPDKWWTSDIKMDCGYKIYDWDETYISTNDSGKMMSSLSASDAEDKKGNVPENQEQANCRRKYNDIVRAICNIKVDIKACEILKTLKDEKKFELSPRQVLALRF